MALMVLLQTVLLVSPVISAKKPAKAFAEKDSLARQVQPDTQSVTHHVITVDGKRLPYTATAGFMKIPDSAGGALASIFYTAYVRGPEIDPARRPIGFAFNGGPGASSMWLHLAAAGPRRAILGDSGLSLPARDTLIDNQYTWLPFCDLVFVDPVGTGYSRPGPNAGLQKFYTVDGDIKAMAEFIRLFLSKNQRWTSPLYLVGESYGTFRAAGLSEYLQSTESKAVDGVILISSVINFQNIAFDPGNDLPYVLAIPSYSAAAWFHRKLPDFAKSDLTTVVDRARHWANNGYLLGLSKGSSLPRNERQELADTLAFFTGLAPEYLLEHGLRISPFTFVRQLLSEQGQTVGLLDGRVTGVNAPPVEIYRYRDPSMFVAAAPITSLINDYLRRELSFSTTLDYVFLSGPVNREWQWSHASSQGYVDESGSLRGAMGVNKNLRVFAAMGYYDLTTPFESQQYAFEHLASDSSLIGRITMKTYTSGHQIYTDIPSLKRLSADVGEFVTRAAAR